MPHTSWSVLIRARPRFLSRELRHLGDALDAVPLQGALPHVTWRGEIP
jgi:hypothetical protein